MPKILVVDDSSSLRSIIRHTLEINGYQVIEAGDGYEAIQKISDDIKLLISDINMPKMNGIELVKNIRNNTSYKALPILILTTESASELKEEGKKAGATGWLVKPFDAEKLLFIIKKLIGSSEM
ncbi:MAG: hypothetical protein A2086_00385 [Spirochaetes bacterium GWD1_27_9]|nr:MAG: hypothetical protein A2Z98_15460 [Spirochaetes bacterium GWB1_27_13]OHD23404.1 MAG: hypothetical protein A2Y34_18775 [Spirochaetes bacterium GWC1_27_15]OHD43027.1 MAG: hypothetical protein A2086_00385 [Spirochaetes bacterium GWD1_27_9]